MTPTVTPTLTPTPTIALSGTTEAKLYLEAVLQAGGTGITPSISACTITLFQQICSNGLWDKIQAFYPMLGGNSSGTKFNGKNPTNSNGAYRLQFNGDWTYSISGITSNGTNSYADTFLLGSNVGNSNNHLGVYMTDNNLGGLTWVGASSTAAYGYYFSIGTDGNGKLFYGNKTDGGITSSENSNPVGFNIISSISTTSNKHFYNGVLKYTATKPAASNIPSSIVIGALNNSGSIIQYYANTYSFVTIGSGLTDTQSSNYTNIINTFNDCLGRNTYPSVTQTPTPSNLPPLTNFIINNSPHAGVTNITGATSAGSVITILSGSYPVSNGQRLTAHHNGITSSINIGITGAAFGFQYFINGVFSGSGNFSPPVVLGIPVGTLSESDIFTFNLS
jgi:hypothetical protein